MPLTLIRHGHTEWNGPPKRFQGHFDVPLSPLGVAQASEFSLGSVNDSYLISSPSLRCRQTIECVFPGFSYECDARFMEIDTGYFTGKLNSDVAEAYPDWWNAWKTQPLATTFPAGEGLRAFSRRVVDGVLDLFATVAIERNVYLFTHGGVLRVLSCYMARRSLNDLWQFEIPNLAQLEIFNCDALNEVLLDE